MQLTRADRALAAGIARAHPLDGRPARATGNHLVAQNDEPEPPTEEFLIKAELQYSRNAGRREQARQREAERLDRSIRPNPWGL